MHPPTTMRLHLKSMTPEAESYSFTADRVKHKVDQTSIE